MRPLTEGKSLLVGFAPLNKRIDSVVELTKPVILVTCIVRGEPINASVGRRNEAIKADRYIVDKLCHLYVSFGAQRSRSGACDFLRVACNALLGCIATLDVGGEFADEFVKLTELAEEAYRAPSKRSVSEVLSIHEL